MKWFVFLQGARGEPGDDGEAGFKGFMGGQGVDGQRGIVGKAVIDVFVTWFINCKITLL